MRSVDIRSLRFLCSNALAHCAALVALLLELFQYLRPVVRSPLSAPGTHGFFRDSSPRPLEYHADPVLVQENLHDH